MSIEKCGSKEEHKAEIFRIIRNHQDKPKGEILKLIKEHIPGITNEEIADVLKELWMWSK